MLDRYEEEERLGRGYGNEKSLSAQDYILRTELPPVHVSEEGEVPNPPGIHILIEAPVDPQLTFCGPNRKGESVGLGTDLGYLLLLLLRLRASAVEHGSSLIGNPEKAIRL